MYRWWHALTEHERGKPAKRLQLPTAPQALSGGVGRPEAGDSSCPLRRSVRLDDAVNGASQPGERAAARRDRAVEPWPPFRVGQLGVLEGRDVCAAVAHLVGQLVDPLRVLTFGAELLAREEPLGTLPRAAGLNIRALLAGLP